jgi:hypothetical protein
MIKQIEMYEKLASGPNNTAILIPFNALGSDVTNTMILKNAIDQQKNTFPQPKKKKSKK